VSARRFRTNSEEDTIELGRQIAHELKRPCVVLLMGNLGAGKTTLTKGIVDGLGVTSPDEVSSPTFTLVHDYGRGVFHIDLYRIEDERGVATLGLDELFDRDDAIVLVEWGERFRHLFPPDSIEIRISHDGDSRDILIA
jgi:tRNA threonylcarbamoyladenosine biosynthesis protein TsaE